ncbi:MAG: VWA domain-containing protein [Vicinamibacterales bacterium]
MTLRQGLLAALVGASVLSAAASAQQAQTPPPPPKPAEEPQQKPMFRGGARYVRVDVFPTDRDGVPIEGLTAQDFEVYEDGKLQQIDTFEFVDIEPEPEEARIDPNSQREGEEAAKDPRARLFVIVLDTKHVEVLGGAHIRRPLIDMLDRLIGPRDLFGVITPQLRPSDLILGRKTLTVTDMLQRYWTWGTSGSITARDQPEEHFTDCFGGPRDSPAMGGEDPHWDPLLTRELVARKRERETLEHLDGLVAKLGSIRDEKKAVIVVTQGWRQFGRNDAAATQLAASDIPGIYIGRGRISRQPQNAAPGQAVDMANCHSQATNLLMMDNRQFFRDLLAKAQRANVSFYPVDPRGLAVFDTPLGQGPPRDILGDFASLRNRRDGLMELAENTDGMALISSNDLSGTLRKLAQSLSTYYLLGYYSSNTKFDGGYRRLEVKVKKPDIKLKARRGYFAPTQEEIDSIAAGRAAASAPVPAETAALAAALARLEEVRHDRDLFLQAARVSDGIVIGAELGVTTRQSAAWQKGGELRLVVSGDSGNQVIETRAIEPMRSGVVVRVPLKADGDVRIDARARSGAGGAADTTLALPAGGGNPLIGDAISFRGFARGLMPAADGRYRRTERATIEAPLGAGAIPDGARVLDRHGKPLNIPITSRERIDPQGTRWITAEVVLAPLAEGDYVIELEATRDAARERKLFAIRVVR